jgi:hypothetical protein
MSKIKDGGPAFPVPMFAVGHAKYESQQQGLSLRDYFAAKAMQGMLACDIDCSPEAVPHIAKSAYIMADALLKARGRG